VQSNADVLSVRQRLGITPDKKDLYCARCTRDGDHMAAEDDTQAPAQQKPVPARKRAPSRAKAASKKRAAAKAAKPRARKTAAAKKTKSRSRIGAGLAAAGDIGRRAKGAVASTTAAATKRIAKAFQAEKAKGFPNAKRALILGAVLAEAVLEVRKPRSSGGRLAQKALSAIGRRLP
jgi:hypothetical protein